MKFTQHGRRFDIEARDPDDHIVACIARTGAFYESDLLDYVRAIVPSGAAGLVAVDVGANIGNHSIYLANFVAQEVLAVEPNPGVLPALRRNAALNGGRITVLPCAVGSRRGSGRMDLASATGNSGMARVRTAGGVHGEPVAIETLDEVVDRYIAGAGRDLRVGVVKIDVEGMELDVLQGADGILGKFQPDLFVEAHDAAALAPIERHLQARGYARLSRWAATPVYHFSFRPSPLRRLRVAWHVAAAAARRRLRRLSLRGPGAPPP